MNYKNINYIRSKELETDNFIDQIRSKKEEEENDFLEQISISSKGIINGSIIIAIIIGLGVIIASVLLFR